MATDATGTPTSLGIPKFNTAVDPPSGKGTNAMMDSINTLLGDRVSKPSGIATGEVPVWNGSTWVRSTTTNIGVTSLGSGSPDNTKFLRGDGTWAVPSTPTISYGTSLPGSPANGDQAIIVDSTTNPTYQWMFRYNSSGSGSHDWEFIGGTPRINTVLTSQGTTSTSYTDLATTGPSITVTQAGEYFVQVGCYIDFGTGEAAQAFMSHYIVGGSAPSDDDAAVAEMTASTSTQFYGSVVSRPVLKTGVAASDVLRARYRVTGANSHNFVRRWISVIPQRIS